MCGRFNDHITVRLLDGVRSTRLRRRAGSTTVDRSRGCPGAFEIPLAAKRFAASGTFDAVICLGAVIRGDTAHFDFVAGECAAGIQQVAARHRRAGGVRRAHHRELDQALARVGGRGGQQGRGGARRTAVEMATCSGSSSGKGSTLMLRLVLPKGSLEQATLELFEDADLGGRRASSDVDYRGHASTIRASPRCASCARRRSRATSPRACSTSASPGATGSRRPTPRSSPSASCTTRRRPRGPINDGARGRRRPHRGRRSKTCPPGLRRAHRVPRADPPLLREARRRRRHPLSYGATEAKVPDIADAVVEITETGRALRAAGLRILDTILVSYTELIANPVAYADPEKRKAMEQLQTLLTGALEARGRVLVKLNVDAADLDARDRAAAGAEVADGVEAVRRGRLRGRDRGGQERDQHADPRRSRTRAPPTSSSCRSPRSSREGRVTSGRSPSSTTHAGRGEVEARRRACDFPFHCTAIADGTRTIEPDTPVRFRLVIGPLGALEATAIDPSD